MPLHAGALGAALNPFLYLGRKENLAVQREEIFYLANVCKQMALFILTRVSAMVWYESPRLRPTSMIVLSSLLRCARIPVVGLADIDT